MISKIMILIFIFVVFYTFFVEIEMIWIYKIKITPTIYQPTLNGIKNMFWNDVTQKKSWQKFLE